MLKILKIPLKIVSQKTTIVFHAYASYYKNLKFGAPVKF
jgi:hypothetical protein